MIDYIVNTMPRLARLDAPGVVPHVIIRGIERRKIFRDDKDRDNFIDRLEDLLSATNTVCYAWALLSNHAHFLLRSGDAGISNLMRRLLTGHALSFNRRHKRHGQLFQNRYKSIICQEDTYLLELVRYIHLNPLRAKIVTDINELNKYEFCGHSVLMGRKKYAWQDRKYVLSYFDRRTGEARKKYLKYVMEELDQGRRPDLVGGGLIRSLGGWREVKKIRRKGQGRHKGDERILGDSDFVLGVLADANEKYERRYKLKSLGYSLEKIEQKVIEIYKIDKEDLYSGSRQKIRPDARSLLCYWAVCELGMNGTDLAKHLGLSQSGVVYSVNKGEKIIKEKGYKFLE